MDVFDFSIAAFVLPLLTVPFFVWFFPWYDEHVAHLPRRLRLPYGLSLFLLVLCLVFVVGCAVNSSF